MTDTINALDILARLKSAVNAAGPDTTRACKYVVEAEPGKFEAHCIAGTVLADLGVPLDVLRAYEDVNVDAIRSQSPDYWGSGAGTGPELPFSLTDAAWDVLAKAQFVQDDGRTWGEAFDSAVRAARLARVPNIPADY